MVFNLKNRKKIHTSLIKRIVINVSIFVFVGIFIFIGIFIHRRYQTFQKRKHEIRLNILKANMQDIKKETTAAYRYIQYSRNHHRQELVSNLKNSVNTQFRFVENYYSLNKGNKSRKAILTDVKAFFNVSEDYKNLFIITLDGRCILNNMSPQWEGREVINYADSAGNSAFKELLREIHKNEKALLNYPSAKKEKDSLFSGKIFFARKFEPLGLIIGEMIKPGNHIESVKRHILKLLTEIRFGEEEYVFVNSYDGRALIKDGELTEKQPNIWDMTDPNGVKVIQEEYKAAQKPGGDYIFYSWKKLTSDEIAPKVSFIRGVDSFEWMLGSGSYIDIIGDKIEEEQKEVEVELVKDIVFIFISLLILLFLAFLIIRNYIRLTKENIKHFTQFFKKAGKEYTRIEKSKLRFSEFHSLADSVNKMIDDRQTMTDQMEKERMLFRYIIDSIPDLIVYQKLDGSYIGCNKAFEKAFEIYSRDIGGKYATDIYPKSQAKKFLSLDKELQDSGPPIRKEEWITLPNGYNYLYDIFKTFYYDHKGNALGIIGIARDITEKEINRIDLKKALEKADESNRIKTKFLENLSHEIRTPLNAISGFTSLIKEEELELEELGFAVGQISNASNRILIVIESILNLSRIQIGEISLKWEAVNIKKCVAETASAIEERFKTEKPELEVEVQSDECPEEFKTDEYWLRIALENIIDNAFKFTREGKIAIQCLNEENGVTIKISDTGIGIPEGAENEVFEYFNQLENPMNKKYQGTGCGLYISKYIIENLGGKLWYESEENTGTIFYVFLSTSKR